MYYLFITKSDKDGKHTQILEKLLPLWILIQNFLTKC